MLSVGTDFSGIGALEQALKNLKIKHKVLFACDNDAHVKKAYHKIHKCDQWFDDVVGRDNSKIEKSIDLYVAGFPCQAFSQAGHRKGFEDTRGTLFFDVAKFIKENQPKTFILENVRGLVTHDKGRTFDVIKSMLSDNGGSINGQILIPYYDDGLGYHIYFQVMNTKEHGIPQNRERIFIIGFKEPQDFTFPPTEKLTSKLTDLIESEVDEKYYLSEKAIESVLLNDKHQKSKVNPDIANCLQSPGHANGTYKGMNAIKVESATKKGYEVAKKGDSISTVQKSATRRGRVGKQVAQTLTNQCAQAVFIGYSRDMKTGEVKNRTFKPIANTLHCSTGGGGNTDQFVGINKTIRKLTPLECWRLQGFPDEVFKKAEKVTSDTQLYKMAGNSITVNVIQKILTKIYK